MIQEMLIKEEHNLTTEEKLKFFGYGEWVEEVDFTEIEYQGYKARVKRVFVKEHFAKELAYFGGYLCGYVKIPSSHPYFGNQDIDLECHGGLTFNKCDEEHWVGFNCAHAYDYVPTMELMKKTHPELKKFREMFPIPQEFENFALFNPVYRNMQYCIEECKKIIRQLIDQD